MFAASSGHRVLVTTYTVENRNQLHRRISERFGAIPPNIDVITWYQLVINELCRPYQRSVLGEIGVPGSLNFSGRPLPYAKKTERRFYMDKGGDLYRNRVSAFALRCDEASGGAAITRLGEIYSHIFIDEMQDLAGHDFEILDRLLRSEMSVFLVGDPRQCLYFTDDSVNNKKYKGPRFVDWLKERSEVCSIEWLTESHRCCQAILEWADKLFPEFNSSSSLHGESRPSDGVHLISRQALRGYLAERENVIVLRPQKNTDTMGLPAVNIGVSKGSTYDHVVLSERSQ